VLGVPEGPYLANASEEGLAHFWRTVDWLGTTGYSIRPAPALRDFEEVRERHFRLTAAEAAEVHREWFPRHRHLYAPQTVDLIERGQAVSAAQIAQDRDAREALRAELDALMDEHEIDLWISPPAQGPAPHGLGNTGHPVMNIPWTQAGMPALSLPAGKNAAGLPIGLQVAGRFGADEALLAWAAEMESVLSS
jgi:Asp-tRNA(Asn)/Glu-tRNA(Gln) amidotransferase A subunit family amidase